ncbi:cilia- and flagella-associated protein 99-like isoform X1 [Pecten maximus]|uniref:cilia- and flagella-associated protein 99-like isoform X1 n=1 Tax=Pecten maximus TaxID=6579 RepID=UPI001458EEE0|nr:cilia- and flagella-associated protein 99-like isoform X1 [Pecten maximus]XP_033756506.1 cilia- and flagella-associated protein 99-like isoform X1 [Pecten maximus]
MASLSHGQLLVHAVRVLDTYNRDMQSVEEHVNKYLKQQKIYDDGDQTFIVEVFSNCVRYWDLMKVITDGFFVKDGKNMLRSEENLYIVTSYLVFFRLDELGVAHFRKFVSAQDINKMYRFLNFCLNERNLITWMKDGWEKFYEHTFVQRSVLSPIQRWMPELQEMLSHMKAKIDNKLKPRRRTTPKTETKPFDITQPRPRSIPIPEPIPKLQKHKSPPRSLYDDPEEFDILKRNRDVNRRKAEERLMEASRIQFACANPEKSDKTKEIWNNIISEEDGKLDFERHRAKPTPSFLSTASERATTRHRVRVISKEVPFKMNTTAILREGHLYSQREEKEVKRLENLEAGAKDKSEFEKWQNKMKTQDLEQELAAIERRRLEGKLSHEEAILARQNLIRSNKQKVLNHREQTKKMFDEFLQQKFREEEEMRILVEQTMQGHKNAKDATKKIQDIKRKIVQDVNEESRELMRQAVEEAEVEMRRRMELIHQIRAMEAVPIIRQKFVDLTATSGHGLLSEMSIAELRERMCLLRTAEEELEEQRRDNILSTKQAKDQKLLDTLETISRHRLEQTKSAAIRFEKRKKGEPGPLQVKDDKLTELERKLEERKATRKREQQSAKITASRSAANRTQNLISQKKALEENRWKELEMTRERTARIMNDGLQTKSANRLAVM